MADTTSHINIILSIEKVFRDYWDTGLGVPVFRFPLPSDIAKQQALIKNRAVFFQLVTGVPDRYFDTMCTAWICERYAGRKFLPEENLVGLWVDREHTNFQQYLNTGLEAESHFFPLYHYEDLIDPSIWNTFDQNGDTSTLAALFTLTPNKIQGTGFVVRTGHSNPTPIVTQDPIVMECTFVFQHFAPDVYCGQRGNTR
jgi:hypothetical protein